MDWRCVDYLWIIVMFFISCLDSHSDGTHSLQRNHWWASDVTKFLQIFYNNQWNETLPESSSSLDISLWKCCEMCKKQHNILSQKCLHRHGFPVCLICNILCMNRIQRWPAKFAKMSSILQSMLHAKLQCTWLDCYHIWQK